MRSRRVWIAAALTASAAAAASVVACSSFSNSETPPTTPDAADARRRGRRRADDRRHGSRRRGGPRCCRRRGHVRHDEAVRRQGVAGLPGRGQRGQLGPQRLRRLADARREEDLLHVDARRQRHHPPLHRVARGPHEAVRHGPAGRAQHALQHRGAPVPPERRVPPALRQREHAAALPRHGGGRVLRRLQGGSARHRAGLSLGAVPLRRRRALFRLDVVLQDRDLPGDDGARRRSVRPRARDGAERAAQAERIPGRQTA